MKVLRMTELKDYGTAMAIVIGYKMVTRELRMYSLWESTPQQRPLVLRVSEEAWEDFRDDYIALRKDQLRQIKGRLEGHAAALAERYTYTRYLAEALHPIAVAAVMTHPPDITWGNARLVHTWTWITTTFMPPRGRGNLAARVFKSVTLFPMLMSDYRGGLYKKLSTISHRVAEHYLRKRRQYVEREGGETRRARLLAIRDTIRIWLGNAWLIATLDALDKGLIEPRDVELPYPLARDPGYLHDLIDPAHTVLNGHRYAEYTWRRLLTSLRR